ncbi:MlaD family protein [Nocardia brasiliensis]|uniref:MlaD family protein n=1 Tax=Nocardia brasiliensis TaxID=37326 RepID=UPI001EEA3B2E|nr:MlaD family protein [Nocardia brasiliensis]
MSLLGAVVLAFAVAAVGVVVTEPLKKRIEYCAIMPDAIGLYVGNDVTLRGIKVGEVTAIRAQGSGIRVDFRVDADRPLRGEVTAATVSDTIVADRRLAVHSGKGADWKPRDCVTKTATPKSITQTLDALAALADQLDGGGDPAERDRIGSAVAEFDRATAGTGPQLNKVITQLAAALRSPDASIARLGSLIDTVASLSKSVAEGWGDLRQMLSGLSPVLQLVNQVWAQVVQIVNSFVVILPWFNDITTKYGDSILALVDASVPFLDLVAAHVGSIEKLIDMIPVVAQGFRDVADPQTGRVTVSYAAPRAALVQSDADQVCAAVNALAPGKCATAAGGLASIDLSTLVLGLTGGGR